MKIVESDSFEHAAFLHIITLKLVSILPFDGHSIHFFGSYLLLIFSSTCGLVIISIFLKYGVVQFRKGIFELDFICETNIATGLYVRYALLYYQRKRVKKVVDRCASLWSRLNLAERQLLGQFAKRMDRIYFLFMMSVGFVVLFYGMAGYFASTPATFNQTAHRVLPGRFYVDVQTTPWFELTYLLEVILIADEGLVSTGVDLAAPFLIMMACGFLRSIANRFRNMSQIDWENETIDAKNDFIDCIRFHQDVLEFSNEIKKISGGIFMVQLMCTTYNLSLGGFHLLGDEPDRYKFSGIIGWCLIQLFVCQWASNCLIEESKTIAEATYSVPAPKNTSKIHSVLLFVIMRSQKPVQMTAGGIVELSLESFGSMISAAVSFFTILRTTDR